MDLKNNKYDEFFNPPKTYTDPETGISINLVNYFKQLKYYMLSRTATWILYHTNNMHDIYRCKTIEKEIADMITNATTVKEVNDINIFKIFEDEGLL